MPNINVLEELPSVGCYTMAFINIHATSENHVNINNDNHKLRVQYLVKEVNENEFKRQIEQNDYTFQRSMAFFEIYSTIFEIGILLFDNLFSFTHKRTTIKNTRIQFFTKHI